MIFGFSASDLSLISLQNADNKIVVDQCKSKVPPPRGKFLNRELWDICCRVLIPVNFNLCPRAPLADQGPLTDSCPLADLGPVADQRPLTDQDPLTD